MKIVLDTNVLVFGLFFRGVPGRITDEVLAGRVKLVVSPEIVGEYLRVGNDLLAKYPNPKVASDLALLPTYIENYICPKLAEPVCSDPTDDKFLACAVHTGTELIISGDKALIGVSGYQGVFVIKPRVFCDERLRSSR